MSPARQRRSEHDFLDPHGRQVHAFSLRMANLGFAQVADAIGSMLRSPSWREFKDGLGTYRFLPGEFDYFLTQQGVSRDDVMHGVRDLDLKAELEAAMDERRTGDETYRRRLEDARAANPTRPDVPIQPFGFRKSESQSLVEAGVLSKPVARAPLGGAVRRYVNTGSAKSPTQALPRVEKIRRSAVRLQDEDLLSLIAALDAERRGRSST